MGSKVQSKAMRAQKREIQMSHSVKKVGVVIWNWKSFLQLFSKFNRKHIIFFFNLLLP
jgi:hypothetical protein